MKYVFKRRKTRVLNRIVNDITQVILHNANEKHTTSINSGKMLTVYFICLKKETLIIWDVSLLKTTISGKIISNLLITNSFSLILLLF